LPDQPALERDVGDLVDAGDLPDSVLLVVAVAVLGDRDLGADRRALREAGVRPVGGAVPRSTRKLNWAYGWSRRTAIEAPCPEGFA
jgi:hypothetical protein